MHVSPSQIETWRGCQRRWAYSRIRPRTTNEYAAFGTRVHSILERWLEHRVTPDHKTAEGLCALAAVPELPQPQQPGAAVEHGFAFVSDGVAIVLCDSVPFFDGWKATCGESSQSRPSRDDAEREACLDAAARRGDRWVAYVGRIDLLDRFEPAAYVRVTDYKTCGDLARADETRSSFEENTQRIVYAIYVAARFAVASVVARWIYLRRTPPKAEPVEMVEGAGDLAARFARVHRNYALPIVRAAGIHPTELPRNLGHCYAYGTRMPCPYLAECHATLSPAERAAALMSAPERGKKASKPMSDLMSMLGASLVPAVATNATPQPAPVPVDPCAGFSDQDREAFAAIQNPPQGATQDQVVTFLASQGKQYIVDAAVRAGIVVAAPVAAVTPAPVVAPASVPVVLPSGPPITPAAPRVRAKSIKADVVENMLRAVLAGAGHSVEQTEAHIERLLG